MLNFVAPEFPVQYQAWIYLASAAALVLFARRWKKARP
jgi:hypothetical protein